MKRKQWIMVAALMAGSLLAWEIGTPTLKPVLSVVEGGEGCLPAACPPVVWRGCVAGGGGLGPFTPAEQILLGYRLDPNRLSEKEWQILPRIGPAMARRIVETREALGGFSSPEMMRAVPGVGEKTVRLLEPFLSDPASKN